MTRRLFLVVASSTLLAVQGGCAWFFLGAGGAVAYTVSESAADEDDNTPPTVQVNDPGRVTGSHATVSYTLTDPDGDSCSIVAEYSTNGGSSFSPATAGPGGDGTSGLSADAGGSAHTFVWDWQTDTGGGLQENVVVALTPTDDDGAAGVRGTSPAFVVGNAAPAVDVDPIPDAAKGIILVTFTLTDQTSDPVDVDVDYALDGSTYQTASIVLGTLTGMSSSPSGDQHTIAWDTVADGIDQSGTETNVTVRVSPTDAYGLAGTPAVTPSFRIGNMKPEVEIVYHNWGTHAASVEVEFLLKDAESDPCSVHVEFSEDGGHTWGVATLVNQTNPVPGQTSSPAGLSKTVLWDIEADQIDMSGGANGNVFLRFRPGDAYNALGTPAMLRLSIGYFFPVRDQSVQTTNNNVFKAPSAAFDTDDHLHAVWVSTAASPSILEHDIRGADGRWAGEATVPTPGLAATDPSIAQGAAGKMHLVWVEATPTDSDIYYKFWNGTSWDTANTNLSQSGTVASMLPVLGVDSLDHVHVIWVEAGTPDRLMYATDATGSWSAPADITPTSESNAANRPDLCVDASDHLHVVYENGIHAMYFGHDGSSWQTTADILTGSETSPVFAPQIAVDDAGLRSVIYTIPSEGTFRFVCHDGSWSTPTTIADYDDASFSDLRAAPDGTVHGLIVGGGAHGMGAGVIRYLYRQNGVWSVPRTPQEREGDGMAVSLALDAGALPHLVWHFAKSWLSGPGDFQQYGIAYRSVDSRWIDFYALEAAGTGDTLLQGSVAAGPSFRIHTTYVQAGSSPDVKYRVFDGTWAGAEDVNGSSTETPETPVISVDGSDLPHVLWVEPLSGTKRVFYNTRSGSWGTPAPVSSDQGDASDPDAAIDASGNLHAVWCRVTASDTLVYYASRNASTSSWSTPVVVSQTTGTCGSPSIAVDDAGGLHVAYDRCTTAPATDGEIYYVCNTGSGWTSPDLRTDGVHFEALETDLIASGSGANLALDLAWTADGDTADRILWLSSYASGAWSTPEKVSDDSYADDVFHHPSLMRDGTGTLIVSGIYDDGGSTFPYHLFLAEKRQGSWINLPPIDSQVTNTNATCALVSDTYGHIHFLFCDGADSVQYGHRR